MYNSHSSSEYRTKLDSKDSVGNVMGNGISVENVETFYRKTLDILLILDILFVVVHCTFWNQKWPETDIFPTLSIDTYFLISILLFTVMVSL